MTRAHILIHEHFLHRISAVAVALKQGCFKTVLLPCLLRRLSEADGPSQLCPQGQHQTRASGRDAELPGTGQSRWSLWLQSQLHETTHAMR